ncbi:hypothetical protein RM549_05140 [Salegentibacter sp. F188]|uniref:Lipoprotein n=1 Tax=Autumnicola patrickiae TaxID=3075591 RepID=A0ABU3DZU7_9FLAO|nr:hypothetical protein [Salegentibacter sp. F188]MDT0689158.1 hypothetical protein [Salegentibacter sp. F188]
MKNNLVNNKPMKMLKKQILVILFFVPLIFSCSEDDDNVIDELPAKTQTGEQTLGFSIDGENFISSGTGNSGPRGFYQEVSNKNFLHIVSEFEKNNEWTSISIYGADISALEETDYKIGERVDTKIWGGITINFGDTDAYFTTDEITGTLIITKFDKENHILSGEFEFDAVNEDGSQIKVKNGRFDLNYIAETTTVSNNL